MGKILKYVDCICIRPNGDLILENVGLEKEWGILEIQGMNASQGPEFIQGKYTYCLHWNTDNDGRDNNNNKNMGDNDRGNIEKNIHSSILLDISCSCGYSCRDCVHYGNFYLTKHDPILRENHKFDFTKEIPNDEIIRYDTHISTTEDDIKFIQMELHGRYAYRSGLISYLKFLGNYYLSKLLSF